MRYAIPLKLSFAALLAAGASAPALAQAPDPYSQQQYDRQLQDYQAQQEQYQAQQRDYEYGAADAQARRDAYSVQQGRWASDRDAYERQRDDYDARYGSGAWERRYGYGYSYHRAEGAYYAPYVSSPCERHEGASAATGGVIGALAGAAIGSNVAGHGDRTGGAVLGALAGGAIGASVGAASAHCDARGYYYSYAQTYPYRAHPGEETWRHDADVRRGCRLAPAPAYVDGRTDYRYVRVCPDPDGRYRIG
jgi:hypothetical protein